jgi:hypothetical protein
LLAGYSEKKETVGGLRTKWIHFAEIHKCITHFAEVTGCDLHE